MEDKKEKTCWFRVLKYIVGAVAIAGLVWLAYTYFMSRKSVSFASPESIVFTVKK